MSTSTTKSTEEQKNSKVGSAVGESSCQKPVAIFPVRYSVMPSAKGSDESFKNLPTLLDKGLPKLDNAEYILRTLRPESYVYVYNENSQNKLTCFFYSQEHKGTSTPRFYYVANLGENFTILPTAFDYIWVDCNQNKKFTKDIEIGYTDAPPSHRTWANLLKDTSLRKKLLPSSVAVNKWQGAIKKAVDSGIPTDLHNFSPDVRSFSPDAHDPKVKNTFFPGAYDPKVKNTFYPSQISLQTHVTDFQGAEFNWSESPKNKNNIGIIKSGMQISNPKEQIAVALYDPIGITSELNNIVAGNYNSFQAYVDKEAHAVASANSLIKFFSDKTSGGQLKAAIKEETARTYRVHKVPSMNGIPRIDISVKAIEMRAKESLQKEVFNYESQLRTNKAGLQAHINNYQKTLANKDKELKSISADAMVWAPSISPSIANQPALQQSQTIADALQFYDRVMFGDETYDDDDYLNNWAAYGFAVYRILSALPIIKEGQKLVGELIAGEVSQNPFWISLAKRREVENNKDSAWNYMKNPTDGVWSLLVTAVGAGHISNKQVEFNTRSLISLMNSTMDHWYNKKELIKRRLNAFVPKSEVSNFLKSTPKRNKLTQIKSNRKAVQTFNKKAAIKLRVLANSKVYGPFTAVVAVIAIIDLRDNFADYKTGPKDDYEGITAVASGLGATSAILITSGVGIDLFDKDGKIDRHLEKIIGKRISTAKLLGGMGGVFGMMGGAVGGTTDARKAFSLFGKGDNDSAAYTAASSVAGLLNAGATGAVGLIGISQAFGGAALGGLVATEGAALTVLGATAFAWATLGLGLFVGVLVLAYFAANAKDKPIEIWLQQTHWGIKPRYKNIVEEVDAMNNLMYRPYVEAEKNDVWKFQNSYWNGADELILDITFPYYVEGKSKFELTENILLNGKKLEKVRNRYEIDQKKNKAYAMKTKLIEKGKGYAKYQVIIILDDDAKARITLDYYPDTENHPNIKISGHPTGKAWEFKDAGWWGDIIDDSEFNSRVDDRR